jgi:flagellar hook-length control protein FliK
MNALLSLAAAPAAGTTAAKVAPARTAGAEAFGGALSSLLAAMPSMAVTTGKQTPSDPGTQDTKGTGPATSPAGADPAGTAGAAPAIFPLPATLAPARAAAPTFPARETGTVPDAGAAPAAPAAGTAPVIQANPTGTPLQLVAAVTTGMQTPSDPGTQDNEDTEGAGSATGLVGVDPVSTAEPAPAIFQLPVTPAPAVAAPATGTPSDVRTANTPATSAVGTTPVVQANMPGTPLQTSAPAPQASAAAPTGAQTPTHPATHEAEDTEGTGRAAAPAGADAASTAVSAPAIFSLPANPAPAHAAGLSLLVSGTGTVPDTDNAAAPAAPAAGPAPAVPANTPGTPWQTAAPVPAPPAAAAAHHGHVRPGLTSVAQEPRKAGDQAGVFPADTSVTAIPNATAPSPAPATPATVFGAAQTAPGGARVEAPASRLTVTAPAGDAAYLPGTPSPTSAPVVTAAAAAPASAPAPAVPVPPGFAAQLARPVFTLASAGTGEHTMTVAVDPENLGPVTVQAHISAAGVRVELFAASADGREALRQILPDLKRDLAGAGLNASLDLSAGNQPGSGQDAREQFFHRRAATAYPGGADSRQLPMNSQASGAAAGLYGTDGSLDVMA